MRLPSVCKHGMCSNMKVLTGERESYFKLVSEAVKAGYSAEIITVEVGSFLART